MVGKQEDRYVSEKLFLSLVILKCDFKSFTKKSILYDMNEDMVTIRPLKTDLSVLQHSISFIPPKDPTGASCVNSAAHEGDIDFIACCIST